MKEDDLNILQLAICLTFLPAVALAQTGWRLQDHERYGRVLTVAVQGEITADDANLVERAVTAVPNTDLRLIVLSSEGGDLRAAMRMGRDLRAHDFDAAIPPGHTCMSACVFLLAAALDKNVQGKVGIHRPYFASGDPGRVAEEVRELKDLSMIYLREMNIPERLAEDMFSVDPGRMRILSSREMEDYRLDSKDYAAQEADIHRMMRNLGMTREEYEALRSDLRYACEIFVGQPDRISACVDGVAERHGVKMGAGR